MFDVTLKTYNGEADSSVSYGGQVARHALHNSLKQITKKADGSNSEAVKAELLSYYEGKHEGRVIIDPVSQTSFPILQKQIDTLAKGKNLKSSAYKGAVSGWPGNLSGAEILSDMIAKASHTNSGFDPINGYDYTQLISKFTMGAVFYNKAVNHYLDEKLEESAYPNDQPYKKGTPYTGKEHVWDEAFGYFGAPAHSLSLTPKEIVQIVKLNPEYLSKADANQDGKVDLVTEMAYAHAYYAASIDSSGKTHYFHTIVKAFYDGRSLINKAAGEKLSPAELKQLHAYAKIIKTTWQQVIAEAAFKYAGEVYNDLENIELLSENGGDIKKSFRNYIKHWSEMKGFVLSLEAAGQELGATQVQLDRLIGFSPVLFGNSQVIAVDGQGEYIQSSSLSMKAYQLNMLKVQNLLANAFSLKARLHDKTAGIATVLEQLDAESSSAEND
ncbi:DUF4856 domain-containing protein [Marinomonas sp. 15G1-11]|uniref:DUF4856 domain-containing protein n=1 Tax=Marinomonas phaeophyticola TaxID=3004091 RepID=A0ABT4JX96_9GAMM|nr:DUF4856 domain-containing protein [Marinomonas sp. 15G1-11]MCZ2722702.1 DUF4856 domain-containing protein [Marinomonas sp. 15G1-11]